MQNEIVITLPKKDWLKNNPKSVLITVDGEIKEITPKDGKHYTLKEMYDHIKTDIVQVLYLPEGRMMVCDEEGALKTDKRQNWIATKILSDVVTSLNRGCLEYFIYGNVMIINDDEIE